MQAQSFEIKDKFHRSGFLYVPAIGRSIFRGHGFYELMDALFNLAITDPAFLGELNKIDAEIRSESGNSRQISAVPRQFRDRRADEGKASKAYLHLCERSLPHLQRLADRLDCPELNRFVIGTSAIFNEGRELLISTLRHFSNGDSDISEKLDFVLKIIRYHGRGDYGTAPHTDKSAFSVLIHATDGFRALRIMPGGRGRPFVSSQANQPVVRIAPDGSADFSILLPGLLAREVGIHDLPASPHSVEPLPLGAVRHSVILFAIPYQTNLDVLRTNVRFCSK